MFGFKINLNIEMNSLEAVKKSISAYPGFPKDGIVFRDIMPIMRNPEVLEQVVTLFVDHIRQHAPGIAGLAGLEARGFLFGPIVALRLKVPFVAIRKAGKLPGEVKRASYTLEYAKATIEIQSESVQPEQSVVILDDLMATGGTMAAAVKMLQEAGAKVEACLTLIELVDLKGKDQLPANVPFHSFIQYG